METAPPTDEASLPSAGCQLSGVLDGGQRRGEFHRHVRSVSVVSKPRGRVPELPGRFATDPHRVDATCDPGETAIAGRHRSRASREVVPRSNSKRQSGWVLPATAGEFPIESRTEP